VNPRVAQEEDFLVKTISK